MLPVATSSYHKTRRSFDRKADSLASFSWCSQRFPRTSFDGSPLSENTYSRILGE